VGIGKLGSCAVAPQHLKAMLDGIFVGTPDRSQTLFAQSELITFLALMPSVSSFGSAVSKPVHVQVSPRHRFDTRMIGRGLYPTKADLSRKYTACMMLVIARSPSATKLRT
jgi:hypothetical protein